MARAEATRYPLRLVQSLHEQKICWEGSRPLSRQWRSTSKRVAVSRKCSWGSELLEQWGQARELSHLTGNQCRASVRWGSRTPSGIRWLHLPATSEASGPKCWGLRVSSLAWPNCCARTPSLYALPQTLFLSSPSVFLPPTNSHLL